MITFAGWLLWNWAEFSIEKEVADNDNDPNTNVTFRGHLAKKYTTIVGSAVCIPIILWIGYRQINIDPFASLIGVDAKLGWHDLYLLGSGAVWEAMIFVIKRIRAFFKKKVSQL